MAVRDGLAGETRCRQCGAELDLSAHAEELQALGDEEAPARHRVECPPGLTVVEEEGRSGYRDAPGEAPATLTIVRRPVRRRIAPFALSAAAFVAVVGLWVFDAFFYASVALAWALAAATVVVLLLLKRHLVVMLDGSVIHATPEGLTASHRPPGTPLARREIAADKVVQLFSAAASKVGSPGVGPYQVKALLSGAVTIVAVDGLATPEQALFIEQKLEGLWSQVDREVAGELPREGGESPVSEHGYQLTHLHPPTPLGARLLPSLLASLVLCALPATAITLFHGSETLAEADVGDEPTTVSFEVSEGHPAVHLISSVNERLVGGVRDPAALPTFDYVIKVRRRGDRGPAPVEQTCDATPADDVGWHISRPELTQFADWFHELDDCSFDIAPGAWEAEVVRRWRNHGRDGDIVRFTRLRIEATRW